MGLGRLGSPGLPSILKRGIKYYYLIFWIQRTSSLFYNTNLGDSRSIKPSGLVKISPLWRSSQGDARRGSRGNCTTNESLRGHRSRLEDWGFELLMCPKDSGVRALRTEEFCSVSSNRHSLQWLLGANSTRVWGNLTWKGGGNWPSGP